ncbi:hypothetical protein CYLTODRAFT_453440 [Cylindrobasidium torrendii FP15055 ss-10]|uniref:Uncharacterized protein n=1 Tax=Cylindrobasidium torrendii FP15055 ss-10 TaxID=1314674 RepID=A0A0D7BG06_9AGAR|nr:hypothetical protein CYLTODRAFT_453440 [Cylindrobasidium torrendii FP15055 ss-10]
MVLTLVIRSSVLGEYVAPPDPIQTATDVAAAVTTIPTAADPTQYIPLLQGAAVEIDRFSGAEQSDWLLSLAHDICDPVHFRGVLCVEAPNHTWRQITVFEPLIDQTYLYELPPTVVIGLSKISLRHNKSATSTAGAAGTMRTAVLRRDNDTCWISRTRASTFSNSHICPKRMEDAQALCILQTFCGYQGANIGVFHPMFGIVLCRSLDNYFDSYELGFRGSGPPDQYRVHCFKLQTLTIAGIPQIPGFPLPPLHNAIVNQPPTPGHADNPLPGLFRWHYLQCVLRRFATQEYRRQSNISYHEIPLRMEDDSSDNDRGDDDEDGWPSASWDRARLAASEAEAEKQRQSAIVAWRTEVR